MKIRNTTYRILSNEVENISSKEYCGASFASLKDAQELAKRCKKDKQPLVEIDGVADILKCTKAVYSKLGDLHVMFVIREDTSELELLCDDPIEESWCTYRPNGDEWQWFARGYGLSMMLNHAMKMDVDRFYFTDTAVIGMRKNSIVCGITTRSEHVPKNITFLPSLDIEPKVIEKKERVVDAHDSVNVDAVAPTVTEELLAKVTKPRKKRIADKTTQPVAKALVDKIPVVEDSASNLIQPQNNSTSRIRKRISSR